MGQNNVRFLKLLGRGSYGEVYKAKWNGRLVAAKRLHPILANLDDGNDKGVVANFARECELLRRLKHDNIVEMLCVITVDNKPPVLITELLDCDLSTHFEERNSTLLLEELVDIMLDVAKGLVYLHDEQVPSIIHRDLCPKNILLDRSNSPSVKAKIADVGLAKILEGGIINHLSPVPGTQAYMAPETFARGSYCTYGTEIDIFSFGMTLLQGIIGKMPCPKENPLAKFEDSTTHSQLHADLQAIGDDNPLKKLVYDCLEDIPEKRPMAKEIVEILSLPALLEEIVQYDFQKVKTRVCDDFHRWIPVRRRTIRELDEMNLEEMTADLDDIHRKANIATAAGASTSVVATGLVIGGFVSSFFTFGATIPVMIAGGAVAAAGGLTTFGAKISEIFLSRINIKKVEDTIAEDKEESDHLKKSIELLDSLIAKYVQRIFDTDVTLKNMQDPSAVDGVTNVMEHFQTMTGVKIMETDQLDPLKSSARAVGAVLSVTSTGVTASTAGARIGTAVFDTLTVASRATHVAGLVASVLTLPIDAYFLVKSVRELKNQSPSEIADKIRAIQTKMVCPQEGDIPSLVEAYVVSKVAEEANTHFYSECNAYDMVDDLDGILLEHEELRTSGKLSFDSVLAPS